MSANTLASALAAARKSSLAAGPQSLSIRVDAQAAAVHTPAAPASAVAAGPAMLSNADALMIAIQRSAGTVDEIMARRTLLGAGRWGVAR